MALTTVADVRATGGIDDAGSYQLFFLADDAALNAAVQKALNRAVSYLKNRASSGVYTGSVTANTDIDSDFAQAEELIALSFLVRRLKSRKIFGSHYPLESEDSPRYHDLIEDELLGEAEKLIGAYVVIEPQAFAAPAFVVTTPVDPSSTQSVEGELDDLIMASLGLKPVPGGNP